MEEKEVVEVVEAVEVDDDVSLMLMPRSLGSLSLSGLRMRINDCKILVSEPCLTARPTREESAADLSSSLEEDEEEALIAVSRAVLSASTMLPVEGAGGGIVVPAVGAEGAEDDEIKAPLIPPLIPPLLASLSSLLSPVVVVSFLVSPDNDGEMLDKADLVAPLERVPP